MKISPITSQTFRGHLIIPNSWYRYDEKITSPKLEVDTNDIIEIDNSKDDETLIIYNNEKNELSEHTYYHRDYNPVNYEKNRILLAYMAAAASRDVVIKA